MSVPPNPTTIRERAQAIREAVNFHVGDEESLAAACDEHAQAILDALDAAKTDIFASHWEDVPGEDAVRLVPETRYVSIPDPGVVSRPSDTPEHT